MKEKAEKVVGKILKEFSGVDGKHSFTVAVVQAIGEEPSDELKEKAKLEEEKAEALGEELHQVSGILKPPDTGEAEGIEEKGGEVEEVTKLEEEGLGEQHRRRSLKL